MKRVILNIHLYAGMIAALFLIAISLSGAIIAFENELNLHLSSSPDKCEA